MYMRSARRSERFLSCVDPSMLNRYKYIRRLLLWKKFSFCTDKNLAKQISPVGGVARSIKKSKEGAFYG